LLEILSATIRELASEITVEPGEGNGLRAQSAAQSAAQCQHVRSVATTRIDGTLGNVGAADLSRIREILELLLDIDP